MTVVAALAVRPRRRGGSGAERGGMGMGELPALAARGVAPLLLRGVAPALK